MKDLRKLNIPLTGTAQTGGWFQPRNHVRNIQKLSEKTCYLRMTAIRILLAYAAEETIDIKTVYVNAKTKKAIRFSKKRLNTLKQSA